MTDRSNSPSELIRDTAALIPSSIERCQAWTTPRVCMNSNYKLRRDPSVSVVIGNIARCAIASIFYFELGSLPERCNRGSTGTGSILCWVRPGKPAFKVLLDQLSTSATFYLNDSLIPGVIGDCSFIGKDGNFRKRAELNLSGRFSISLKQGVFLLCYLHIYISFDPV